MAAVSWSEAQATLKTMRAEQTRAPAKVLRLAAPLLKAPSSLGDEVFALYEQVCVAALDCNRPEIFEDCYSKLLSRFGKESVRVGLLDGQRLEAEGKYDEAQAKYDELLKAEPTAPTPRKRAVAIAVAKGDFETALKKLNAYLDKFPADPEGWTEMASLSLKMSRFESAKFSYEELILTNPYNHLFHQRLAEVLYTMGGNANLALSRKHFAQAVNLNPKSARALYGLLMVSKKLSLSGDKEAADLANRAQTLLAELYKGKPNEPLLNSLVTQINGPAK